MAMRNEYLEKNNRAHRISENKFTLLLRDGSDYNYYNLTFPRKNLINIANFFITSVIFVADGSPTFFLNFAYKHL